MLRPSRRLLALALAGAVAAGCDTGAARPEGASTPTAASVSPVPPADVETARHQLTGLVVTERRRPEGYLRTAFGQAWKDTDGNGCNQRDDVLLREAVPGSVRVARQGSCDHDVLAGRWRDPYSGRTIELDDAKDPAQAQAVQIDHVVSLAEAWASGAGAWSAHRREIFANDLAGLLAVDGPTNASKGADDPAAWRPRKDYQCAYAARWVAIKSRWELAVDASEVRALGEMLGHCS